MKNVSTFGRNEYVGKQGTADSVESSAVPTALRLGVGVAWGGGWAERGWAERGWAKRDSGMKRR